MDTNDLLVQAKARFDHASARRVLKERYQAKMYFAHAGGMWCAGPELQMILMSCPGEEAVLLDYYEKPVKVNVADLLSLSQTRWQEQMTAWLLEYQEYARQR